MRKRIEWKWEQLDENTARAKVIGGWLVAAHFIVREGNKAPHVDCCMQYVPDKDHFWEITKPLEEVKKDSSNVLAVDFERPK